MRISVCVATKNRTDMLHQLIWSLIRQEYQDWDLVIVDDSDVPVQWNNLGVYPRLFNEIIRTGHDIRIVPGPRVSRIGAAFQTGLAKAKKENPLFLRVDDDSWLEPDYLVRLVDLMKDSAVAACGGLFLHPGQDIETLSVDDDRYKNATIEYLSDKVNIQWFHHTLRSPRQVEHLTANILFSKRWLEKIGGFEKHLYRQHRDETQVTWRLYVEGAKLFVDPKAVAWHLKGMNGGARGPSPDVFINDHRTFMAQRRSMAPGIHVNLGHGIGDGLMATPMLHVLRKMNPDRDISVYAPWAKDVLKRNPDVNQVAENALDAQRTVRLEQSVYAWAGAHRWTGHLAQAYCKMFQLPEPEDLRPRLQIDGDSDGADDSCDQPGYPYIVIAPWSNARTFDFYQPSGNKNWPLERWSKIISWAHENGLKVVQLRGSDEEPLLEDVDLDFCRRPLASAFDCISHAKMVVSVDTMAHHVAAAFDIPTVVLWGRSKPEHFGYRTDNIVNIQGACPGLPAPTSSDETKSDGKEIETVIQDRPCIHGDQWAMDQKACPIEGHPCMSSIAPETVIAAMESLRWQE